MGRSVKVDDHNDPDIDPSDALAHQQRGAVLIDVREPDEQTAGMPRDARPLVMGAVEEGIGALVADREREILTVCATGIRSAYARDTLRRMGYKRVASVRGGFVRWCAEGLPLADGTLDADSVDRYSRHLLLPEIGVAGQHRLSDARIVLVGAGGLARDRRSGAEAAFRGANRAGWRRWTRLAEFAVSGGRWRRTPDADR